MILLNLASAENKDTMTVTVSGVPNLNFSKILMCSKRLGANCVSTCCEFKPLRGYSDKCFIQKYGE